jgi:hypothetical protein
MNMRIAVMEKQIRGTHNYINIAKDEIKKVGAARAKQQKIGVEHSPYIIK